MSNLERNNQAQSQSEEMVNHQEVATEITNHSRQAIIQAMEREGVLGRLFPDERKRAAAKGELELIETEYKKAHRFLEIIRETQIQSMTETCNQYLKRDKGEARANVHEYLLQKTKELAEEMDQITAEYFSKLDDKLQELEKIQSPKIREIRELQLNRDLEYFAELQQELMTRFKKIVSEGV
jgi:hypothetical protein